MFPKIVHPTASTEQPSTGKVVRYRPMQAREEKILLHAKESDDDDDVLSVVSDVVQNCVQEPGFKVSDCTLFDVEWLFLRIRMQSVSPVAEVAYIDREDGQRYEFSVDLSAVAVEKPPVETSFKVNDEVAIELRWPSVADFSSARKAGDKMTEELMASCVGKVFNGDEVIDAQKQPRAELRDFVDSLDLESYRKIGEFMAAMPRLSHVIEYTNSRGSQRRIVMDKLTDFFAFR